MPSATWARPSARTDLLDAVVAIVLFAAFVAQLSGSDVGASRSADPIAYLLAGLATLPLAVRRRFPEPVLVMSAVAVPVYVALGYPQMLTGIGMLFALHAVASARSRRVSVPAMLIVIAVVTVVVLVQDWPTGSLQSLALDCLLAVVAWALGDSARSRGLRIGAVQAEAQRLASERSAHAERAVAEERVRIARELHDVVAHGMGVIAVQAGMGSHLLATQPEKAREALEAIERTSRQALAEMRKLLGLLRDTEADHANDLVPQPGLRDLDSLVADIRASGVPVRLSMVGQVRQLPRAVELSAYRIVQEALTNVLKHAGPATATVTLTYEETELGIDVHDDGSGRVAVPSVGGHGLVGMRERAALFGGDIDAGPSAPGGWRVATRLPTQELS